MRAAFVMLLFDGALLSFADAFAPLADAAAMLLPLFRHFFAATDAFAAFRFASRADYAMIAYADYFIAFAIFAFAADIAGFSRYAAYWRHAFDFRYLPCHMPRQLLICGDTFLRAAIYVLLLL